MGRDASPSDPDPARVTTARTLPSRPRQYKQVASRYLNTATTTATTSSSTSTPAPTSTVATATTTATTTAPGAPRPPARSNPADSNPPKASTTLGLNHSSTPLTSSPDVDWERAMDARLAQWRYINLVAVAELQAEEAAACTGINASAVRLESAMDDVATLTARLDAARARSAGPTFAARAREPLATLVAALEGMSPAHARCCAALVAALHALPTRNIVADPGAAAALAREVARFRVAATEFAEAAAAQGADPAAADALEDLARVVADEAPGVRRVLCSTVKEAAAALEEETRDRAADTSRRRSGRKRSGRISSRAAAGGDGGKDDGDSKQTRKRSFPALPLSSSPYVQRMAATAGLG